LTEVPAGLTSWTRLEPLSRDPSLAQGLQARVADPLWLLARQATFGEFEGQDAAIPVAVRLRARVSALTRLRPGPADQDGVGGEKLSANAAPLERLLEADDGGAAAPGPLECAKAGLHYLRLLRQTAGIGDLSTYIGGLLSSYPCPHLAGEAGQNPGEPPPPQTGSAALRAYAGHVPDGAALFAAFKAAGLSPNGSLPPTPPLGAADEALVTATAQRWYAWYEALYVKGAGVPQEWDPARLEHTFSVAAPCSDHERVFLDQ
jgi:hypothetical protein